MAVTTDELRVLVTAEVDNALKGFKKVEASQKSVTTSALSMAKKFAGPAVAGLMLASFVKIGKENSKMAARADEIKSKYNTVFGSTAGVIEDWATDYSAAMGRSKTDTLDFLATIKDTFTPLGIAGEAANNMAKKVVTLAGDLASFNDLPTEEVIAGIQSALVGNVETLRRYGVVANESSIKQEALNSGLWDGEGALTAQEKAQAILNITMKGTVDAQGDLARTQDSTANTMVRLESATNDLKIVLGQSINDGITPMAGATAILVSNMAAWLTKSRDINIATNEIKETGKSTSESVEDLSGAIAKLNQDLDDNQNYEGIALDNAQSDAQIASIKEVFSLREDQIRLDIAIANGQITQIKAVEAAAARSAALNKRYAGEQIANAAAEKKAAEEAAAAAARQATLDNARLGFLENIRTINQQVLGGLIEGNGVVEKQAALEATLRDLITEKFDVQNTGYQNTLALGEKYGIYLENQVAMERQAATKSMDVVRDRRDAEQESIIDFNEWKVEHQAAADAAALAKEQELINAKKALQSQLVADIGRSLGYIDTIRDNADEAELQRMEEELATEEELDAKKKKIAHDNAKREKAFALLNAGINMALGITKALTLPFPYNIAAASITGAAGALQVAAIASAPIPAYADGGEFETSGPKTIMVGDNPGGVERVSVEPVSSVGANESNGSGGGINRLYIGEREFQAYLQSSLNNGDYRIPKRMVV